MADICFISECKYQANFTCLCDPIIKICQNHISQHLDTKGMHEIVSSINEITKSQLRTSSALKTLTDLNSKTLNEGKEMFQELCNKLCSMGDMFARRQQSLVDLSTEKFSPELESKIQELETVDIRFRKKEEFQQLLDRHLSNAPDLFDFSYFQEFKKDFQNIALSLQKNNEYLEIVAQKTSKQKKISKRVKALEDRLNQHDQFFRTQEVQLSDFRVDIENCLKQTFAVENLVNKQSRKIRNTSKVTVEGFSNEKKTLEMMFLEKCSDLNKKIAQVQANERDFAARVEKVINDIKEDKKRRIELLKKQEIDALEREKELKIEREELEKNKLRSEKGKINIVKVDAMNINEKIEYLYDAFLRFVGWGAAGNQWIRELILSNDGNYLFLCEFNYRL